MGTIIARDKKNGETSYTAQVRIKKHGKTVFNQTETFMRRMDAKRWIERKERELRRPGALDTAISKKRARSLFDVIDVYIDAHPEPIGKSKLQNLRAIQRMDIASEVATDLQAADFVQLARDLAAGVQPAPIDPNTAPLDHYDLSPRSPATTAGYLSHLTVAMEHGAAIAGLSLPIDALREARVTARHLKYTGKSKKRDRRPTIQELDRLMRRFECTSEEDPRAVPMHKVTLAALFLCYRQSELTRIAIEDLDRGEGHGDDVTLLLRDMKDPSGSDGNHFTSLLRREGLAVADMMNVKAGRILPWHPDTIGRRWTDACRLEGIEDLHFHDLRHEGISRLFELGMDAPQVAAVTGHSSWDTLKRYTHIRRRGDKYANWEWLRLLAPTR